AEGVLKAMLVTRLKTATAVLLVLGLVALTCGAAAMVQTNARQDASETSAAEDGAKPKEANLDKASPLTVSIEPDQHHVRVKKPFDVHLRVVNSSKSTQSFEVMNDIWYEHWKSSDKQVIREGWQGAETSLENSRVTVTLQPGQAYEKELPMLLGAGNPGEKVPFKMGFTPRGSEQTYWSNEVTLQVEAEDPPAKSKLWAAISVSQPVFVAKNVTVSGIFQINFTVVNDGDMTVDPEISTSKLFVNGKQL